ncbi:hypothetical protein [Lutibacter sp. HS1-25]|uniref:hypothetical protein n=1 Tax=Lutibacter sp. HS1-25 TaxID=2485000 RepID=UPI001012E4C7|nr:hypothetical protein [Lutibacter sp. HS1-25]
MQNSVMYLFVTFALFIFLTSCKSVNPYVKYNYFNGATFINDTLNISTELFGDIKYHPIKRKEIKMKIRGIKELKCKDLLVYGTTYISPYYDLLLFYNTQNKQITDSVKTTVLLKDTLKNRILIKKSLDNKNVFLYLKSVKTQKTNVPLILDAENIISNVRFDTLAKSQLTYANIFNEHKDIDNYLLVKNKFETAPIKSTDRSDWDKFQYLATVLSHDASNKELKALLDDFEVKRRAYFQPKIDSLMAIEEGITLGESAVIQKLKELSKNEQIFMLNENHWYPNHRILATKLLAPLKENGYTYLAIEALSQGQDSLLISDKNTKIEGAKNYPTKNTGYYTREPYFGNYIREALRLGYKLIGYEYEGVGDREVVQANNIKKILDNDSNAKIVVYAGLDHIYEDSSGRGRRMASYFKEFTGINPLTVDQTHLFGNAKSELALFNIDLFEGDKKLNTNVDYLLINDINSSLDAVFDEETMADFSIVEKELNTYLNEEILVSVFYKEEYAKYKSASVPILNKIINITSKQIDLRLPIGEYYLKIRDVNDNTILLKEIIVDNLQ